MTIIKKEKEEWMNGGMTGEVTREEDPTHFSVDDRHDDYVTSRDVSGVMLQGRH